MGIPSLEEQRRRRALIERQDAELAEFRAFGARRHWKIEDSRGGKMAARRFTYRCGARALLWIDRPDDMRAYWEAGLNLPFSAGPEGSLSDRRFAPVRDWVIMYETILQAPLDLEKAQTQTAVSSVMRTIDRHKAWWTICAVFDIDYRGTDAEMTEALIARQAPQMTP